MIKTVKEHLAKVAEFAATDLEAIEQFRIQYSGKKGILNDLFAAFREVPNEDKKEFGQVLNQLKTSFSSLNILFVYVKIYMLKYINYVSC